jgi:hypothetical protein
MPSKMSFMCLIYKGKVQYCDGFSDKRSQKEGIGYPQGGKPIVPYKEYRLRFFCENENGTTNTLNP